MSASAREVLGDWILDRDIPLRAGESVNKQSDQILAALSSAGLVVVPRDGMKVPHDAAAAFWRRFQELHNAETGARGFYESFGGGWNALVAMLSAAEGKK